jgi:cysteinyl-tRNA synthetase
MSLPQVSLTNTLSGKKELLKTLRQGHVNLYMCGPTVYGYTHIGNARAALAGDLIVRSLEFLGYTVTYARNVTDIDDKIIKKAQEEARDSTSVAQEFEEAYNQELSELGVRQPDHTPHATEHVAGMHDIIRGLMGKGFAYTADTPFGKDVYFRVEKFEGYGKLSKRKTDDMMAGARIEVGEAKESPLDFALWKAAKPGEPSWSFENVGAGRPGWHIECSAMIHSLFPEGLDIHMGGLDLVFPHHENEIAQSEAAHNKTLAPYWLHNGLLTIQREKMSKSLGNIFKTRDFLDQFGPETLRLIYLQHHYRGPIDFSDESILRAEALVERLYRAKEKVLQHAQAAAEGMATPSSFVALDKFSDALCDDFNSAKILGHLLGALRTCYKEDLPALWKIWGEKTLPICTKVFGLLTKEPAQAVQELRARRLKRMKISEERAHQIDALLLSRETLRKEKKFEEADHVRKDLEAQGLVIMDGPDGSCWSVAESAR